MTWFKVDDNLHSHRKARKAGLEAIGLWTVAGSYASDQLTDGFVPDWFVAGWPRGKALAATLVTAGLWTADQDAGEEGWRFHEWGQRNPSRDKELARLDATRKRQQEWRDKQASNSARNALRDASKGA